VILHTPGVKKTSDRELRQQLMELALGYWRSQVLFAATELGVFDALHAGGLTALALAKRWGRSYEHVLRLLNACAALGLLDKQGDCFTNTRLAQQFLVQTGPEFMGHWVQFMSTSYAPWGGLADTIRRGEPIQQEGHAQIGEGQDFTRDLILAMHDYARGPGRLALSALDLPGRRRLLDVGGGPGTYSALLVRRNPELSAVVFDLPPVLEITRELIDAAGLADRVALQPGSYLVDELGAGYDVVLLSNMLHQEDPDTVLRLLRKAYAALTDGGQLVIQGAFLDAAETGPMWPVLQSLQLLLFYRGGRAYSIDETLAMASEAGFANPVARKPSLLSAESLVLATKK